MSPVPRYRDLAKAALLTAALSLLAFGIAHMLFITWAADRSADPSLLLRLGLMLGAPMLIGALPSAISALVGAFVWRRTWGTPLAGRAWGPVLASALLPALVVNLVAGPGGETPPAWLMPTVLAGVLLVPALLGAVVARSAWGLLAGAAALPIGATLSMFAATTALGGWVAPFVLATLLILGASGLLMQRSSARLAPTIALPMG